MPVVVFRRCMKMPLYANKLFISKLHQIFIQKFNFYFIGGWMSLCFFFTHFFCVLFATNVWWNWFDGSKQKKKQTKTKRNRLISKLDFLIVGLIWEYFISCLCLCTFFFIKSSVHDFLRACLGVMPTISVGSSRFSHLNLDNFIEPSNWIKIAAILKLIAICKTEEH